MLGFVVITKRASKNKPQLLTSNKGSHCLFYFFVSSHCVEPVREAQRGMHISRSEDSGQRPGEGIGGAPSAGGPQRRRDPSAQGNTSNISLQHVSEGQWGFGCLMELCVVRTSWYGSSNRLWAPSNWKRRECTSRRRLWGHWRLCWSSSGRPKSQWVCLSLNPS